MKTTHVVFDRALPLSESAAAGVDHRSMTDSQLLGALLITNFARQGNDAAVALVRAALALPAPRMRLEDLPAGAMF